MFDMFHELLVRYGHKFECVVLFHRQTLRALGKINQWRKGLRISAGCARWIIAAISLVVYALRVYSIQGFFIITYALGIYILNVCVGVMTPQVRLFQPERSGIRN